MSAATSGTHKTIPFRPCSCPSQCLTPNNAFVALLHACSVSTVSGESTLQLKQSYGLVQVVKTISRGKVVWDGKALHVREGEGQFVKCPKYGSLFEGLAVQDQNHLHEKYPYGSIPIKRSLYHGKSQKTEL